MINAFFVCLVSGVESSPNAGTPKKEEPANVAPVTFNICLLSIVLFLYIIVNFFSNEVNGSCTTETHPDNATP